VDTSTTRFEQAAGEVDLVFDTVGGDRLARSAGGRTQGRPLVSVASERARSLPTRVGSQPFILWFRQTARNWIEIAQLADGGALAPQVGEVFPWTKPERLLSTACCAMEPAKSSFGLRMNSRVVRF